MSRDAEVRVFGCDDLWRHITGERGAYLWICKILEFNNEIRNQSENPVYTVYLPNFDQKINDT